MLLDFEWPKEKLFRLDNFCLKKKHLKKICTMFRFCWRIIRVFAKSMLRIKIYVTNDAFNKVFQKTNKKSFKI